LTSIVLGYEVSVGVGMTVSFAREHKLSRPYVVHMSFLIGAFGAAVVAGKLMRLNHDGLVNALGICALTPISPFEVTIRVGWDG